MTDKELFEKRLDAKTIVEHKKGHYDPDSRVKENPTVLKEILEIAT